MSDFPNTSILYDGECPVCCRKKRFLRKMDRNGQLRFSNIREPGFRSPANNIDFSILEKSIHAELADGSIVSGMDAVRAAYQAIGLEWLIAPTRWPFLRQFFDRLYCWIAKNRHAISRILH